MSIKESKVLILVDVKPARRHKCEMCERIFECHICTPTYTHVIHCDRETPIRNIYVCLICAYIMRWDNILLIGAVKGHRSHNRASLYKYKTGELLEQAKFTHRKDTTARWLRAGVTLEDINKKFESNWEKIQWQKVQK